MQIGIFATEGYRFSNLVKQELFPEHGYNRDVITANETGATAYVVGTVLGKVTATGKYKVQKATASDGSEVAAAVVVRDVTTGAGTDTAVLALVRGPAIISKGALVLDATVDTDAEKNAVYAALEAKGILVNQTV